MSDQLIELEELLPQLEAAMAANKLDDSAKRALEKLADAPRQAKRFEAFVLAISKMGQPWINLTRTALQDAVNEADEVGKALESANTSERIQDASDEFLDTLKPAIANLDRSVSSVWQRIAREQFEPFAGPGALLSKIPSTQSLGQRLLATAHRARALTERRVEAEELARMVAQLMSERGELRAELQEVSEGQSEVDSFIEALLHNEATLRHLTSDVLKWLTARDALDSFAVKAAD